MSHAPLRPSLSHLSCCLLGMVTAVKNMTLTSISSENGAAAVIILTMWLLDFWNWFTRGIKIVWNFGLKKTFNIAKQSLMGGSEEVKVPRTNVDNEGLVHDWDKDC